MARIRTIKPTFFRDQDIADLPLTARLTFIGLWTYVDDEGRGVDDPRLVKGDLWQLDEKHTTKKVDADLQLLHDRGRILRYEVAGRRYLLVTNWRKHQRINRPSPSLIPCPITEDSVNAPVSGTEDSRGEGKGREGNKEKGSDSPPSEGGVAGSLDSRSACVLPPSPCPSDGDGSTKLPEEQVALNVDRTRAARDALRSVS